MTAKELLTQEYIRFTKRNPQMTGKFTVELGSDLFDRFMTECLPVCKEIEDVLVLEDTDHEGFVVFKSCLVRRSSVPGDGIAFVVEGKTSE